MAGAHLDSVLAGPGINDNGSGSAAILEAAEQLANTKLQNTRPLRVVGRRGERAGRLDELRQRAEPGGEGPDRALPQLRHDRLAELHLHGRTTATSRASRHRSPVPPGSVAIEDLFESFYTLSGEPYDDAAVQRAQRLPGVHQQRHPRRRPLHRRRGAQDRRAAGDLGRHRRGAVRPVLPRGVRHVRNNSDHALDVNADAVAFAVLTYAYSTETVNGVPGKESPATSPSRLLRVLRARSFPNRVAHNEGAADRPPLAC